MKKTIMLLVMLFTAVAFSQNKNAKATIEVDGVCMMCKKRIEKACFKTKGVKSAEWNVDTHQLVVVYDERKTSLKIINENIAAVGHDTKTVKASDEAYNSVHECCKYRDEELIKEHHK